MPGAMPDHRRRAPSAPPRRSQPRSRRAAGAKASGASASTARSRRPPVRGRDLVDGAEHVEDSHRGHGGLGPRIVSVSGRVPVHCQTSFQLPDNHDRLYRDDQVKKSRRLIQQGQSVRRKPIPGAPARAALRRPESDRRGSSIRSAAGRRRRRRRTRGGWRRSPRPGSRRSGGRRWRDRQGKGAIGPSTSRSTAPRVMLAGSLISW